MQQFGRAVPSGNPVRTILAHKVQEEQIFRHDQGGNLTRHRRKFCEKTRRKRERDSYIQ